MVCLVTACCLALAGAPAGARPGSQPESRPEADAPPAPPESRAPDAPQPNFWQRDDRWTARIEPGVWYAGASGYLTMPRSSESSGGNGRWSLEALGQNSTSVVVPLGEVNLRKGDWGITLRGFQMSSTQTATGFDGMIGDLPIESGDAIESSSDLTGIDLEARYRVLPDQARTVLRGKARLRPRLEVIAGARLYESSWQVRNNSLVVEAPQRNDTEADEVFVHPVVGVKGSLEFYDELSLDVVLAMGGMPTEETFGYTFDILVGGSWKPTNHVGLQFGYRALFFDLSSGSGDAEFDFQATIQGLHAGLVLEF